LTALFVIYVITGPLLWVGLCVLSMFARVRMGRLLRSKDQLHEPAPTLAIVVPAKDEAGNIQECVRRLFAQDYPGFELVVINDRSTDSTGEQLDDLAGQNPRLIVKHVQSLPAGWLGKCHALNVGTRGLSCDWILFVDSDVNLAPDAARRMVALAQTRGYDALSALPTLEFAGFADRLLLPVLAVAWGAAFMVSLTNDDSKKHIAAANGQLFLIRRSVYEDAGNHEAVKDKIVEDVELARHLKANGARVRLMLGQPLATTRMHDTWPRIMHGWARIFAGTARGSTGPMWAILAVVWIGTMSAFLAILIGLLGSSSAVLIAAAIHLIMVFGYLFQSYRAAGLAFWQSLVFVPLLPIAAVGLSIVLIFSLISSRRGWVEWRGERVRL